MTIPEGWTLAHYQSEVTTTTVVTPGSYRLERRVDTSIQNVAGETLDEAIARANEYDSRTLPTQSGDVRPEPEVPAEDVVIA